MAGIHANPTQPLPLRDIHLPEAVSWWPPAWGWWLLVLAVVLAAGLAWWLLRRWPARRRTASLRRQALRELDAVEADYRASGDPRAAVAALSMLLRRLALSVAPREQVAGLAGEPWLDWLRSRCDDPTFRELAAVLAESPYHPDPEVDVPALLAGCRAFVAAVAEEGPAP